MSSPTPGSPAWYALPNSNTSRVAVNAGRTALNATLNKYAGLTAVIGNAPKLTINRPIATLTTVERRTKTNELELLKKSAAGLMTRYKELKTVRGAEASAKLIQEELLNYRKRIYALQAELGAKGGTRRNIRKLRKTRKNLRRRI